MKRSFASRLPVTALDARRAAQAEQLRLQIRRRRFSDEVSRADRFQCGRLLPALADGRVSLAEVRRWREETRARLLWRFLQLEDPLAAAAALEHLRRQSPEGGPEDEDRGGRDGAAGQEAPPRRRQERSPPQSVAARESVPPEARLCAARSPRPPAGPDRSPSRRPKHVRFLPTPPPPPPPASPVWPEPQLPASWLRAQQEERAARRRELPEPARRHPRPLLRRPGPFPIVADRARVLESLQNKPPPPRWDGTRRRP